MVDFLNIQTNGPPYTAKLGLWSGGNVSLEKKKKKKLNILTHLHPQLLHKYSNKWSPFFFLFDCNSGVETQILVL